MTTQQWHTFKDNPPGAEVKKFMPGGWFDDTWETLPSWENTPRNIEKLVSMNWTHYLDTTPPSPPPRPDPDEEAFQEAFQKYDALRDVPVSLPDYKAGFYDGRKSVNKEKGSEG